MVPPSLPNKMSRHFIERLWYTEVRVKGPVIVSLLNRPRTRDVTLKLPLFAFLSFLFREIASEEVRSVLPCNHPLSFQPLSMKKKKKEKKKNKKKKKKINK